MSSQRQQHSGHSPQRAPYRPGDGLLGPVQALAQAYHRTHARTQSEQLPSTAFLPDGYNHASGPQASAQSTNPPPRPPSSLIPGSSYSLTVPPSSSTTDELVHAFAHLASSSSHASGAPQGASSGVSPPSLLKPLPALPPARTPSQHRHQQQNQLPYTPHASSPPSLALVQEWPNVEGRPSRHIPFPSPLGSSSRLPNSTPPPRPLSVQHHSAPRPPPAPTSSLAEYGMSLPRPPIQFPEPRAHMRPPTNLNPPRLPGHEPVPSHSPDARIEPQPTVRPSTTAAQHRPQLPSRPHSDQATVRPSQQLKIGTGSSSVSPGPSAVHSRRSPRPQPSSSSSSSSSTELSTRARAHSGIAESPGRTIGLREALPPPLPGQCWGIKRDGTRCTRKVGKSASNTPTSSPRRTSPNKNARSQQHVGSDRGGCSSPSDQRKSSQPPRKTGATRGRPIILSSDSEEDDDDDDDDSWIVHDSSDEAEYQKKSRSLPQQQMHRAPASTSTSALLLLPPGADARRRHRRSRSAGAEPPALLDSARFEPNPKSHSDNGHWLDAEGFTSASDDDEQEERSKIRTERRLIEPAYCFQHISEINKSPGFYISRSSHARTGVQRHDSSTDKYVSFVQYLQGPSGALLGQQAQASLRSVMSAPFTAADIKGLDGGEGGGGGGDGGRVGAQGQVSSKGYMYIYELRAFSTSTEVCLKVGRTSNVFRRMAEWKGRCRRRGADLVLIGFEPSPQSQRAASGTGLAAGRSGAPAQGVIGGVAEVWCEGIYGSHKWERLTHLELLDIGRRLDEGRCEDCGARHREIFMIPRELGPGQTDAIEAVRDVVRKWEGFVRRLVGEE